MDPPFDRTDPAPRGRWKQRLLGVGLGLVIAVLVFIGLPALLWMGCTSRIPQAIDRAQCGACEASLQELNGIVAAYAQAHGSLPSAAGEDFFQALIASREIESSAAGRLHCAADMGSLYESGAGLYRGYAFRDNLTCPVRRGDPERAIAACGNREEQNHRDLTLVLMADGTIRKLSLSEMRKQGLVAANEDRLLVGPDSPLPMLRELRH